MADVILTLKIMPESPDVDLNQLEADIKKEISEYGGEVGEVKFEEVAFGLKALLVVFAMDESKGDTEPLEEKLNAIDGIVSVQVIDVRRALG